MLGNKANQTCMNLLIACLELVLVDVFVFSLRDILLYMYVMFQAH